MTPMRSVKKEKRDIGSSGDKAQNPTDLNEPAGILFDSLVKDREKTEKEGWGCAHEYTYHNIC